MGNSKMKKVQSFLKTPKGYVLLTLILLAVIAAVGAQDVRGLINTAVSVGAAVLLDAAFCFMQKRKRIVPDGAAITGLIIALVLGTDVPWHVCLLTSTAAIMSKHILKIRKKPIFNPAAFGLLASLILFSSAQSWWGGLPLIPAWCIVFLLIGGFIVTRRVVKFPQVFAFLGLYFSLFLLFGLWNAGDAGDALRAPFINSALFLAFFMVTDPPTSPASAKDQVWFGLIAAAVSVPIFAGFGGLAYLLTGLLAANGWNAWRVRSSSRAGAKQIRHVRATG